MKVSYLLAAVAILGLAGFAMAAQGDKGHKGHRGHKAPQGLHGKVVSVNGANVTVKTRAKEVVVATDAGTAVTIGGNIATNGVADLKPGMRVLVTPKIGTAKKIAAKTAVAHKGGKKTAAAHKGGHKKAGNK
jgi:hypothetical protein